MRDGGKTTLNEQQLITAINTLMNSVATIKCTARSREIFEAFDELLLLKPGGRVIFNGPLGQDQANLIRHFEAQRGVPK